jgi:hypothetical protein
MEEGIAKKLLTKEEFDKFIEDLAKSVETDSKRLEKYNSWHFPFGNRINIFQKYFGIGGIGLRIENRVELLREGADGKTLIGALAEVKIVNDKGETVANATRLGMKADWPVKDKFVEKAQQYALESALGYLGIRSSEEDGGNTSNYSNSQGSRPQYNNQNRETTVQRSASPATVVNKVVAKPVVTTTVAPKPVVATPVVPSPKVEAVIAQVVVAAKKEEAVAKVTAEGVKQVDYIPPTTSKDDGKIVFEKEDKKAVNEVYFASKLPKEIKAKYFALWTGECKREHLKRFLEMFVAFEKAYEANETQAIREVNALEGRGKMKVDAYNLDIAQKIIA